MTATQTLTTLRLSPYLTLPLKFHIKCCAKHAKGSYIAARRASGRRAKLTVPGPALLLSQRGPSHNDQTAGLSENDAARGVTLPVVHAPSARGSGAVRGAKAAGSQKDTRRAQWPAANARRTSTQIIRGGDPSKGKGNAKKSSLQTELSSQVWGIKSARHYGGGRISAQVDRPLRTCYEHAIKDRNAAWRRVSRRESALAPTPHKCRSTPNSPDPQVPGRSSCSTQHEARKFWLPHGSI